MKRAGFMSRLGRFFKNRDGVSAVEFALILPVFATLYFGSIEVSFLMTVDRKVTHTASALGDLTARGTVLTRTEVGDIFAASRALFEPYDGSQAEMRVTSIQRNNGRNEVVWSESQNMTAYAEGSEVSVPNGLLQNGDSVIMAEVAYDYNSTLGYFLPSARRLDETFYLRPRRVDVVELAD